MATSWSALTTFIKTFAILVSSWCLLSALLDPASLPPCAFLVPYWCLLGAFSVPSWSCLVALHGALIPSWTLLVHYLVPSPSAVLLLSWCLLGVVLVPPWSAHSAFLAPSWVHYWCPSRYLRGALLAPFSLPSWCLLAALLVSSWCLLGIFLLPSWCLPGASWVLFWCPSRCCGILML